MKISVLTPTFNRASSYLPQCVESVQRQYGSVEYEHVIVDDRSSDETWEFLCDAASSDSRIIPVRSNSNGGPARALNLAADRASGDFVLPLDDDDLLLPWSLTMHADFLDFDPDIDVTFGWAILVDADSKLDLWGFAKYGVDLEKTGYSEDPTNFLEIMWARNSIFNSTAMVRRSKIEEVGGWDENVGCQDWAMWLSLLEHGCRYRRNATYLSAYRIHDLQLTNNHSVDGTYDRDEAYLRRRFNR